MTGIRSFIWKWPNTVIAVTVPVSVCVSGMGWMAVSTGLTEASLMEESCDNGLHLPVSSNPLLHKSPLRMCFVCSFGMDSTPKSLATITCPPKKKYLNWTTFIVLAKLRAIYQHRLVVHLLPLRDHAIPGYTGDQIIMYIHHGIGYTHHGLMYIHHGLRYIMV